MTSAFGWLTRLFVAAILIIPPTISPQSAAAPSGERPVAGAEVRLRKLHLVRPDLIPYPIAYEVCC